jgi:hypothetical protein
MIWIIIDLLRDRDDNSKLTVIVNGGNDKNFNWLPKTIGYRKIICYKPGTGPVSLSFHSFFKKAMKGG